MNIEEEMIEAIKYGNADKLSLLIKRGGDVNKATTHDYIGVGGPSKWAYLSLLMQALIRIPKHRIIACIKLLIDAGADVNFQQRYLNDFHTVELKHHSVLTLALKESREPEVIKLLVDAGADVNYTDSRGYFPAYYASSDNIEFLVNVGVDLNREVPHHGSLLSYKLSYRYAIHNDRKIIKIIIDAGANVDYINSKGESLLLGAIDARQVEVVCMLIDAGAAVDYMDPEGNTALIRAEQQDTHPELIKILKDADIKNIELESAEGPVEKPSTGPNFYLIFAVVFAVLSLILGISLYITLLIIIANLVAAYGFHHLIHLK